MPQLEGVKVTEPAQDEEDDEEETHEFDAGHHTYADCAAHAEHVVYCDAPEPEPELEPPLPVDGQLLAIDVVGP
jgi:hypothetical protein